MRDGSLIERQRGLVRDLARIGTERGKTEPTLAKTYQDGMERVEQEYEQGADRARARLAKEQQALDAAMADSREACETRFAADQEALQKEHVKAKRDLAARLATDKETAEDALRETQWAIDAAHEGALGEARTQLRDNHANLAAWMENLQQLEQAARAQLEEWNQPIGDIEDRAKPSRKPNREPEAYTEEVTRLLGGIRGLVVPRFLKGKRLVGLIFLLWLALVVPLGFIISALLKLDTRIDLLLGIGAAASTVFAGVAWIIADGVLKSTAHRQVDKLFRPLVERMREAETTRQQLETRYQSDHDTAVQTAKTRQARDLGKAQEAHQQKVESIAYHRTVAQASIEDRLNKQRTTITLRRETDLTGAADRHQQGHAKAKAQHDTTLARLDERRKAQVDEILASHLTQWRSLVGTWQELLTNARRDAAEVVAASDKLFPAWDDPSWQAWQPATAQPPAIRFGSFDVRTETVVAEEPWVAGRPRPEPVELTLPALAAFPESSLLLHARDEGRDRAVETLRTVMFRLLTALPPGRVRFVIIDPVGLGQNFAAFMNLADHDESLVANRIWTEAAHIDQRLADLTAHMENVIQKYLRNRYSTITEYNTHAGEVAEPFRVLVVANFPANFTTEAMRRLVSIAQSGPRCGVSTLISYDTRQPLPKDFEVADLENCAINLLWEDGHFRWRDGDFGRYPLALDRLPGDDFCNRILARVGEDAKGAHRVEVPFSFIAPTEDRYWSATSRQVITVPLGRSGATKRQLMELGKGTSQHALVVGKTGSGKSTLLHALITNVSLLYSPDEVELYLIDFKKGVEFKTYAVHDLPHARVVAIESEREFGLSVLQRLDGELKARGEKFRAVGAQDVNSYRQAVPDARMPRMILIVDEFQEFFTDDDRIAQDAAGLLDRLVRQGRAFGMHILLGSQTLGGAYSLARSTIDQMAVRIALQCSEADAHLVLSDDNSAARLLSRPGEAIYNDANGLIEGNDPFQVVWLSEAQREQYLTRIQGLVQERPPKARPGQVVFEGNASADVRRNHLLHALLTEPGKPEEGVERGWLGEAMAIDELTAAAFRRQNGSNLVIVGQQAEAVQGMLTTAAVSLVAHAPETRVYVIDGRQGDAPKTGAFGRLAEVLGEAGRVIGLRELPGVMAELTAELEKRQADPAAEVPSVYLLLYGLQRMRDLRRQEDDFGYLSRGDEPQAASPAKQLTALLKEGPSLGMHAVVWSDTLNNLQQALDRQALREFALRVAFQMNVADSSNLLDSPAASKLGMYRALFANEDEGRLEKFRPYTVPDDGWLDWARGRLQERGAGVK